MQAKQVNGKTNCARGTDNYAPPDDASVIKARRACHIFYTLEDDGHIPHALAMKPLNASRGAYEGWVHASVYPDENISLIRGLYGFWCW